MLFYPNYYWGVIMAKQEATSMAVSTYDDSSKADAKEASMFDKVVVTVDPIITKVYQDANHCEDENARKRAIELIGEYEEYQDRDDKCRTAKRKSQKLKKIIDKVTSPEEKDRLWKDYNDLKMEIEQCYVEPVDIYRLGVEFLKYESQDTRYRRTLEFEDAKKEREAQRDREKESNKTELNTKIAEIDLWSSVSMKSISSKLGASIGSGAISYGILDSLKDVEIHGVKLENIWVWALGVGSLTSPFMEYYLSKKKSVKTEEYAKKDEEVETKAIADISEKRRELSSQCRDIYSLEYVKKKAIYEVCFGSADSFPDNPIEADDKRRESIGMDSKRTPLIAVKADTPEDIKNTADKLSEKADEVFDNE